MDQRKRQSHYIEIIAFDFRNIYTGITLNGISAGLVENILSPDVIEYFIIGERFEPYASPFEVLEGFPLSLIDNGNCCVNAVLPAGKFSQHPNRIIFVGRLSEDLAVNG